MTEPRLDPTRTYPFDPDWVIHPGATLREWIENANLPVKSVARLGGMTEHQLQAILDGKRKITPIVADQLEAATINNIPARFWLALEHNFRVGLAAGKSWTP